jgi:hypothetical protein
VPLFVEHQDDDDDRILLDYINELDDAGSYWQSHQALPVPLAGKIASMLSLLLTSVILLGQKVVAQTCSSEPKPWGFFTNNTIYQTTGAESITYPRFVELMDGTIIATASLSGHTPGYFPVLESTDGGATWEYVSDLRDQVNGYGMSAQPALTELTEPMAGYPAGTIMGTGNSWGTNATRIDLYASRDRARTWEFVSHIAQGGKANTTNGATPIWEPYLLLVHQQS